MSSTEAGALPAVDPAARSLACEPPHGQPDPDANPLAHRVARAEPHARAEAEPRFEALFRNSPALMAVTTHAGRRFIDVNPAFLTTLGYTREEVLGKTAAELKLFLDPERHQALAKMLERGGVMSNVELAVRRKDGTILHGLFFGEMLRGQGEECWLTVMLDVTEQKQARLALEQSNRRLTEAIEQTQALAEQAQAASLIKSEFLANMSHEIRTPLNGVIGMTGLLLATSLSDQQLHYVRTILESSESLLTLINDILDFSKLEAHRVELEELEFDIAELVGNTLGTLALGAEHKGLALTAHFDPKLPSALVGDASRLRQILANLVHNAIKFTERGRITVRVEVLKDTPSDLGLRFSVEDTGIGIAPDRQLRLFEKFRQLDASTTRRFGGTGLGLAISKRLAELMGGTIGVVSQEGHGSTFWFSVSLRRVGPRPHLLDSLRATPPVAHNAALAAPRPLFAEALRPRVLVAEDNAINREIVATLLSHFGAEVQLAEDGRVAVERSSQESFDLILMDVQMPELDGFEATRMIRHSESDQGRARTPILAMTAHARREDRERCLAEGMDDHLPKPITTDAFRSALTRWLGARFLAVPEEEHPSGVGCEGMCQGSPVCSHPLNQAQQRFDASGLLRRVAGDQSLVRRVLAGFLDDIPRQLLELDHSVELADREGVKRHAHTIRGAAATVGGLVLAAEAEALENLVPDASFEDLAARARTVAEEFAQLRDTLSASFLTPFPTGTHHEDSHR